MRFAPSRIATLGLPALCLGIACGSADASDAQVFGDLKVGETAVGTPRSFCQATLYSIEPGRVEANLRLSAPVHFGEPLPLVLGKVSDDATASIVRRDEGFFVVVHLADGIDEEEEVMAAIGAFLGGIEDACMDSDRVAPKAFSGIELSKMLAHDPPYDTGIR